MKQFFLTGKTKHLPGLFITVSSLLLCACNQSTPSLFIAQPASQTHIGFQNTPAKGDRLGILYYLYYYNGGGVATGDINNDGLTDIYFSSNDKGKNKLYLNKGNFQFEDITEQAGVAGAADWCTGVTMADVNGDGWLDIYVTAMTNAHGLTGKNQLFINRHLSQSGMVSFKESAAEYGLDFSGYGTQAAFFDYDHDGDLDCYLLNASNRPSDNITDTSHRREMDPKAGDRFYRNNLSDSVPQKKFTDVSRPAGIYQSSLGYGLGIAVADLNNDGWEDIYIGNDFHENDYYYINNGNGTFTESGAKVFNHYSRFSMGNDVADYNNDGNLDIITTDMLPPDEKVLKTYGSDENADIYNFKITSNGYQHQNSKNCLQRNNGNGSSFSETALLSGVSATDWSWAALFADFDNDGNKDLFITSGIKKRPVDLDFVRYISNAYVKKNLNSTNKYDDMALEKMPDGSSHPFLFKGDGGFNFTDVSNDWGTGKLKGCSTGASYADLDNDGDLDLVVNCVDAPALVLKNNAPQKNYLSVSFKGDDLNTYGIGAKLYLFQQQKMQYQQLMLTRGFQSSGDTRLHFGLDTTAVIDSALVIWPGGKFQVLKNIPVNQSLTIYERDANGLFDYTTYFKSVPALFSPVTGSPVKWKHQEDGFDDFNVQYLIPHCESTRGPKIATGDINKDGLDDFFACGAKGQAGVLMLQKPEGTFLSIDTALFNADADCEDVDAVFFDANNDGYTDLYVVSGGNEYESNDQLLDRLYLNDGKGHFKKSINSLPAIRQNKSCVAVADIDKDGDADLFMGVLADANAYGIPQTSYLCLNDGKGNFTPANTDIISLQQLGIVTTAQFADINADGAPDLIVAGEWMPLTIFINHQGKFTKTTVPASTGLWQTIYVDDVNGDGKQDILAGNWGYNNKFYSGKNGPLRMYVADFDKNGKTEQLLSYTKNGIEYPFLAKDEVERPLPLLKKHYVLYSEYAGVPMKDVFYGWVDTVKPYTAERLGSAVFYGDGNGKFEVQDLPEALQLAPVFAFQQLGNVFNSANSYISGGNFFDVIPYEGRYDAQALAVFTGGNKDALNYKHQPFLAQIKGQVRDLKWLHATGRKDVLLVARNNDSLLLLTMNH